MLHEPNEPYFERCYAILVKMCEKQMRQIILHIQKKLRDVL